MCNIKQIEESLETLIKDDREFVAMLSGEWGIGKTYFWKNFVQKKELTREAYISLFGHNSLDDIKANIMTELSMINHDKLKQVSNQLKDLQIMGISVGGVFSMLRNEDFNNAIVCFDDFERLSGDIKIKDVMGLISWLKEERKCKVVMILNEKELSNLSDIDGQKHDEVFALYKEKVVDYTFHYHPSFDEVFEIVKADIEAFKTECVKDIFSEVRLKNIRIMKQVIYSLNKFNFINEYGLDERVIKEFMDTALKIFIFYAKTNSSYKDLKALDNYMIKKQVKGREEFKKKKEYEKLEKNYSEIHYFATKDKIVKLLYKYLSHSKIEEAKYRELLLNNHKNLQGYILQENLQNINEKIWLDFNFSIKKGCEEVLENMKQYEKYIVQAISIDNFHYYIQLIKHNGIIIDDNFEEKIIKEYIKFTPAHIGRFRHTPDYYLEFIKENYPHFLSYTEEIKEEKLIREVDLNQLIKVLEKVTSRWGKNEIYMLNNLDKEIYKKYILKSKDLVCVIVEFLKSHSGKSDFPDAVKKIKEVLLELKKESKDNSYRVDKIMEKVGIKLEK